MVFYIVHLAFLITLGFTIPLILAFDPEITPIYIAYEVLSLCEAITFIAVNFINYFSSSPEHGIIGALKVYYKQGIAADILACSPLTLALAWSDGPLWVIIPLRLIRLLAVIRT